MRRAASGRACRQGWLKRAVRRRPASVPFATARCGHEARAAAERGREGPDGGALCTAGMRLPLLLEPAGTEAARVAARCVLRQQQDANA